MRRLCENATKSNCKNSGNAAKSNCKNSENAAYAAKSHCKSSENAAKSHCESSEDAAKLYQLPAEGPRGEDGMRAVATVKAVGGSESLSASHPGHVRILYRTEQSNMKPPNKNSKVDRRASL